MTRTETVPLADFATHEATWRTEGWVFTRIATYRSEGQRMARVTLVREEEQDD